MQVNIAQVNRGEVLKGKVVLVTGASSGIGLAIAKKCLTEGAAVIITGRNQKKLIDVSQMIDNPSLKPLVWDVSNIKITEKK